MARRGSELSDRQGRSIFGNGVVFALVVISVAFYVMFFGQGNHIDVERNPHPKLEYEVLVSTNDAPEPLTPSSISVSYSVAQTGPKPCYPIDSFVGAPINRPADQTVQFPLQAVGAHLYRGVITADAFQDGVYYRDYPACHWNIDIISATLKGKTQDFSIDMGDWDPPEATEYFPKEPDKQETAAGLDTGAPSRNLLYIPIPDIWTVQMTVAPLSSQLPQIAAVAARRNGNFPADILDPAAYVSDPLAYPKKQEAIEKMAKTGEKIQAVRSDVVPSDGVRATLVIVGPAGDTGTSTQSRRLVIMSKDNKDLVPVAQNDNIIPCSRCDDLLDDTSSMLRPIGSPFIKRAFRDDYLSSKLKGFQVFIEGGTRYHWWRIYTFVRSDQQNDWMLFAAELGIIDTDSGTRNEIDLTTKDFGAIRFADFNPAALRQPKLP